MSNSLKKVVTKLSPVASGGSVTIETILETIKLQFLFLSSTIELDEFDKLFRTVLKNLSSLYTRNAMDVEFPVS